MTMPKGHSLGGLVTSLGVNCAKIASNCPDDFVICSQKYASEVMVVPHMCF